MAASKQWAVRPADQRFWTVEDLYNRTKRHADESREKEMYLSLCKAIPTADGDLVLQGERGSATFTHYSFGQLSNLVGAPASYLRGLPVELAAQNLNHGLPNVEGRKQLLFHQNGGLQLMAVTSDRYSRIWNHEVASVGLTLANNGWKTPPAWYSPVEGVPVRTATVADCLTNSLVKVGDQISPSGLYASDHDCFMFLVDDRKDFEVDGERLCRGVFLSNSEVGSARFKLTAFAYDFVCGNHIVWGAKVFAEVAIRHIGDARIYFQQALKHANQYLNQGNIEVNIIQEAKKRMIADTREKTIDVIFGKGLLGRKQAEAAYAFAEKYETTHRAAPNSAWGFVSGVTRLSQLSAYQDDRDRMDRAAGKILEMF